MRGSQVDNNTPEWRKKPDRARIQAAGGMARGGRKLALARVCARNKAQTAETCRIPLPFLSPKPPTPPGIVTPLLSIPHPILQLPSPQYGITEGGYARYRAAGKIAHTHARKAEKRAAGGENTEGRSGGIMHMHTRARGETGGNRAIARGEKRRGGRESAQPKTAKMVLYDVKFRNGGLGGAR